MSYFDLHVHPSVKGTLSTDPKKTYTAWKKFYLLRPLSGILEPFKQIINSQATLTDLKTGNVLAVVVLHSIEIAFARNLIINQFLADPKLKICDLDQQLLNDVKNELKTYFEVFQKDLQQLSNAITNSDNKFKIIKNIGELDPTQLNAVLSVEGAHCFQDKFSYDTSDEIETSITTNFETFKRNSEFRLHHLTLAHLTRQPACVHCFGVKMKAIFRSYNVFRELEFLPDPTKIGIIKPLGEKIIEIAYDDKIGQRVLIDIKHMSLVAREEFYTLRKDKGWEAIPIIASHFGVTGTSYDKLTIRNILWGDYLDECDEIFWCANKGLCGTKFNPWTMGLYDEDIIKILRSNGLIGISLDQRTLGEGLIYGEYMSKLEVEKLDLEKYEVLGCPDTHENSVSIEEDRAPYKDFFNDEQVLEFLFRKGIIREGINTLKQIKEAIKEAFREKFRGLMPEMLFPLDELLAKRKLANTGGPSHIDYLANNILHVLKVGLENGFDGTNEEPDVRKCICIGSDLDGLIEALNFPRAKDEEDKWITVKEYAGLAEELVISIDRCKLDDDFLKTSIIGTKTLVEDIMSNNGLEFLKKNFK